MTELQKFIISKLLLGYNIAGSASYGYRLRSPEQLVCRKFSRKTFRSFSKLLSKRGGVFMINKNKVRQLHGKSWVKQQYKSMAKKIPG
jgi:hypothetical protein